MNEHPYAKTNQNSIKSRKSVPEKNKEKHHPASQPANERTNGLRACAKVGKKPAKTLAKTPGQDTWPLETAAAAAAVIKYETVGQTVDGFAFSALPTEGAGNDSVQRQAKERSPPRHSSESRKFIYNALDRRRGPDAT